MRKWVIAGIVLLSFCVLVVLAVANLNSLVNRNKDYLLAQAEQALGRKVAVGEVAVTLWNGIGLRLESFVLSDDPSFSSRDFIRAKDLQVNVKLLPLLRKEFQVKRLILHEPAIEIIRNQSGEFNFSTIGKDEAEREKEKTAEEREADRKKVPPHLFVSLVDISGGAVHYLDRREAIDLRARAIDFRVKDFSFDKPFSVDLAGALLSDKQNVKAQTRVGPLGSPGDLSKIPLESKIDIDPIDFGKLKSAVPAVRAALPKDLDLSGIWRVKDLRLKGTLNKFAIQGTVEGTHGAMSFGKAFQKAAGIPLILSTDAQYAGKTLSFRQAKVKLNTAEVAGKGEVRLGDVRAVNLSLDSNKISLAGWEKMVPLVESYRLSGNAELHATLQGKMGKGAAPQIQGTLTLSGVSAQPPQFPKPIKDLNTKINFTGQKAEIGETALSLGNSRIRLAARIERFSPLTFSYRISTPEIRPADFQASLPEERKADVIKNFSSEGTLGAKNGALAFQGKLASAQGTLYKINY
ncbi:MAG: AsmA family protein, partial [Candidatus Binatia bacterium]